jgi:hypothetical protein
MRNPRDYNVMAFQQKHTADLSKYTKFLADIKEESNPFGPGGIPACLAYLMTFLFEVRKISF